MGRWIDESLFTFFNGTLGNAVGDAVWPVITDYDRILPVRLLLVALWVLLLWKGGRRGRTVALLIIPLLVITDRISSGVLKDLFARPRPCHSVDGDPIMQGIRLLVDCGPGKSFPSSHAVNNTALAVLFSRYFSRWRWAFFLWAGLVAFSRIAVGVHYPSDVIGGALVGAFLAMVVIRSWELLEKNLPPPLGTRVPAQEES